MDSLRMLGSLLLVQRQMEDALAGGVMLSAKPVPTGFCEVVDVGPDVEWLYPGQLVVMDAHGGTEVRVNNQSLVVFRHDQVLAIVDAD